MPIFNDQKFNDTLTYDIISFEQLVPEFFFCLLHVIRNIFSYSGLNAFIVNIE